MRASQSNSSMCCRAPPSSGYSLGAATGTAGACRQRPRRTAGLVVVWVASDRAITSGSMWARTTTFGRWVGCRADQKNAPRHADLGAAIPTPPVAESAAAAWQAGRSGRRPAGRAALCRSTLAGSGVWRFHCTMIWRVARSRAASSDCGVAAIWAQPNVSATGSKSAAARIRETSVGLAVTADVAMRSSVRRP